MASKKPITAPPASSLAKSKSVSKTLQGPVGIVEEYETIQKMLDGEAPQWILPPNPKIQIS
ncbi:MAG: hypothetical protein AAFR61_29640 [Bacteroidota bacterium]